MIADLSGQVMGAPIVIGGSGGSGTRVLRNALIAASVFMGTRVNAAGDALDFEPWLDCRINHILAATRTLDYSLSDLPCALRTEILDELRFRVGGYVRDLPRPGMPWGWKNPRSIFMLPFLAELFPALRFVHVVRDGRDMAFSGNQNQLRKHFEALVGDDHDAMTQAEKSAVMWQAVNCGAAAAGSRLLQERYTALRFEDVCEHPREILPILWRRLDLGAGVRETEAACVAIRIPSGVGRWRSQDLDSVVRLHRRAGVGLHRFGYQGLRCTLPGSGIIMPAVEQGPTLIVLPEPGPPGQDTDLQGKLRQHFSEGVEGQGSAARAAARVDAWVAARPQCEFPSVLDDGEVHTWLQMIDTEMCPPLIVPLSKASLAFWIRWCEASARVPAVAVVLPVGLSGGTYSRQLRDFLELELWTRGCRRVAFTTDAEGVSAMAAWLASVGWPRSSDLPMILAGLSASSDESARSPLVLRRIARAFFVREQGAEGLFEVASEVLALCDADRQLLSDELQQLYVSRGQQAIESRELFLAQRELMRLFERLHGDTQALFSSLTWKIGDRFAGIGRLLFRLPKATARDHIAYLHRRYLEWRQNRQTPLGRLHCRSLPRATFPDALRVVALICRHADGSPIASAYVRVILPLTHPSVHARVEFKAITPDVLANSDAQLLIVQRTAVRTPELAEQIVQSCRDRGIRLVLEMDDDLFASPSQLASRGSYDHQVVDVLRRIAGAADHVIVSTEPLKKILEEYNSNVSVVANALDEFLWLGAGTKEIAGAAGKRGDEPVRILYMGTRTHAKDLHLVGDALRQIRAEYGDRVRIDLIGGVPECDATWSDVFTHIDATIPEEYPEFVRWICNNRHWDIGIIPLESIAFNRSKSWLKFLDFSALQLAIVCSDVPAYEGIAREGVNALCVGDSHPSWHTELVRLVEDAELRRRLSEAALSDLKSEHLLKYRAPEYVDILECVAGRVGERHGEKRAQPPLVFDEAAYLQRNPDVAALIAAGYWSSGRAYWEQVGRIEAALGEPMQPV